ncbi:MAG TPA: peptidase M23, partial [Micromonosporaceae bacterium]|nr:peptidase M23 [Micromonosporaceae bacterium]
MRARPLLLILLVLANLAWTQPADPREDKKRIDAELAQTGALLETASAEAQHALTRLAELNQALPVARQRAAEARGAVAAAENQAAASQRQAEAAQAVWQTASHRYDVAADRVNEGRVRLGRFVAVTYQGGDIAEFNAIVGSAGPAEFMMRAEYARKIAEHKKEAVDGLVGALWDAKHVSNETGMAKRAADAAVAAAKAALIEAAQARDEAEHSARDLADLVSRQQAAVAGAESHRSDMLERYEEVKRESERIAAELRAWEAAQAQAGHPGPVLQPGARLLMPVRGWKSSDFGQRYDPYYHVWQLHAGMDIAAGGGEPIYAAADGNVASAGWRGGYGNYTCLSHGSYQGRSMSTCYAHQSRILVNYGQWVSRGQLIGRVGTTGASTGNHL